MYRQKSDDNTPISVAEHSAADSQQQNAVSTDTPADIDQSHTEETEEEGKVEIVGWSLS